MCVSTTSGLKTCLKKEKWSKKRKEKKNPKPQTVGLGLVGYFKREPSISEKHHLTVLVKSNAERGFLWSSPFSLKVEFPKVPQLYESPPWESHQLEHADSSGEAEGCHGKWVLSPVLQMATPTWLTWMTRCPFFTILLPPPPRNFITPISPQILNSCSSVVNCILLIWVSCVMGHVCICVQASSPSFCDSM